MRSVILAVAAAAAAFCSAGSADDGRVLRQEVAIEAPVAEVWRAFTTAEGLQSWMAPVAEIDLRVGGLMRSNYDERATLGGPGTISNRILSYEPERMLSLQVSPDENSPAIAHRLEDTWSVIRFEPLDAGTTRIVVTGMGYGEGEEWDAIYEFFRRGNEWTLQQLKRSLEDGAEAAAPAEPGSPAPAPAEAAGADGASAFDALKRFAGRTFEGAARTSDGGELRGRSRLRAILDGAFVIAEGELGFNGAPLHGHMQMVYGVDPATGRLSFWAFGEGGSVATGDVRLLEGNRLAHAWVQHSATGETAYYVQLEIESDDAYTFTLSPSADGGRTPSGPAGVTMRYSATVRHE